jgi:hypothetical protein
VAGRRAVSAGAAYVDPWGSSAGPEVFVGGTFVSIIRVGLSETKNFADGYDAIFGKKKAGQAKNAEAKAASATGKAAKKKKKGKKK